MTRLFHNWNDGFAKAHGPCHSGHSCAYGSPDLLGRTGRRRLMWETGVFADPSHVVDSQVYPSVLFGGDQIFLRGLL